MGYDERNFLAGDLQNLLLALGPDRALLQTRKQLVKMGREFVNRNVTNIGSFKLVMLAKLPLKLFNKIGKLLRKLVATLLLLQKTERF